MSTCEALSTVHTFAAATPRKIFVNLVAPAISLAASAAALVQVCFRRWLPAYTRRLACITVFVGLQSALLVAQGYVYQIGVPRFSTPQPVEMGEVHLGTGNLHLQIPIGTFALRSGGRVTYALVYDSRIWRVVGNQWQPINVGNSQSGWRLVALPDTGSVAFTTSSTPCGPGQNIQSWSNFVWTDSIGTTRVFPIQTTQNPCTGVNVSSADAFAVDSSGFHMYVTNFNNATVVAEDGTKFFPVLKDVNGNFFSSDQNGNIIDTLGRTDVTASVNGNVTTYTVLTAYGSASFTLTTVSQSVATAFSQSGITEYSGAIPLVQSIGLPDNTSYQFTYDTGTTSGFYGSIATMKVPTGSTVTYSFTNFTDAYGNVNRWLSSRTANGGTWTYADTVLTTCPPGGTGCQQQLTVTEPSNDQIVYTFTLNNGAWNTHTQFYTGSSGSGTLLKDVTTDYDFSNSCPTGSCTGSAYIQPIRLTELDPIPGGTLSRKVEYSYGDTNTGNVTAVKQWGYYTGTPNSSPDREVDLSYLSGSAYTAKDILSRATSVTLKNAAGLQIAQALNSYDGGSLSSLTGVVQHDDANYGASNTVRGNLTSVQQWISGSTYLTTGRTFDTTGQVITITNPRGYFQTYSYTDNYFTDVAPGQTPVNPPASHSTTSPTNAFPTQITLVNLPGSGNLSFGYYFNTGNLAVDLDVNLAAIYHHHIDPMNRETHVYDRLLINGTRGWKLTNYATANEIGYYTGITGGSASTSCTSCRHDRLILESLGRPSKREIVNDPGGLTEVDVIYGPVGRISSVSNPYRSTTDPTYGLESYSYDVLDRQLSNTHQDGTSTHLYYGSSVNSHGGISSQLCPSATFGLGYPTLSVDEAGKMKQSWNDAFGNTIEIDEPDSTNALTVSTCYQYDAMNNLLQVVQGAQTRTFTYDGLRRQLTSAQPESGTTTTYFTTRGGQVCSGQAGDPCRRLDPRGITTTYTYDALDRLTGLSYSDTTPSVTYFYDQSSYNGLTITYGGGRRTGMSDGTGQTAWSYDPAGHVLTEQRTIAGITKSISYSYHLDGSFASIAYPSGHTVLYSYSNAQRVVGVSDSGSGINYATSASYAPQGALASVTHGSVSGGFAGITRTYGYTNRLLPGSYSASSSNGSVQNLTYSFFTNGNVSNINNNLVTGRSQILSYDPLNRVQTAHSQATSGTDCWGQSYSYDRFGNLLGMTVTQCSAPSLSLTVNNNNQIAGFSYDSAGNVTNDGSSTYAWDAENRLTSGGGVNYSYDGDGWRVKKDNGELGWYDSACTHALLFETDLAGNVTSEYVYLGPGIRIARRDGSGTVYYYFDDHLGSGRVMTDANGITQQESEFYPYGNERVITNVVTNEFKFTGKKRDLETGLDYSHLRMYAASFGRWHSVDPVPAALMDPQSLNRYAYVSGNPSNFVDPTGGFLLSLLGSGGLCDEFDLLFGPGDLGDPTFCLSFLLPLPLIVEPPARPPDPCRPFLRTGGENAKCNALTETAHIEIRNAGTTGFKVDNVNAEPGNGVLLEGRPFPEPSFSVRESHWGVHFSTNFGGSIIWTAHVTCGNIGLSIGPQPQLIMCPPTASPTPHRPSGPPVLIPRPKPPLTRPGFPL